MKNVNIVRQTVIINDDYVRKNRRSDGKIAINYGFADGKNKRIILNKFVIDKNITLLNNAEIEDTKQRINRVSEGDVIAHEYQHIHNGALGYHYLANSDNIYECMMLAVADEISAMIAGYMHKTNDADDAINATIDNMSKTVRQQYIKGQFANHFAHLQQVWGTTRNLYEYKYDSKKIKRVVEYYFTINGKNIFQQNIGKSTKLKFDTFMLEFKNEIREFIKKTYPAKTNTVEGNKR